MKSRKIFILLESIIAHTELYNTGPIIKANNTIQVAPGLSRMHAALWLHTNYTAVSTHLVLDLLI